MSLSPQKFVRKPFVVEAVEVTAENLEEVAAWCDGEIRTTKQVGEHTKTSYTVKYIKVKVKRALNDRQTKAFIGDRVLKAGTGFKVYTEQAFFNSFEKVLEEDDSQDEDFETQGVSALLTLLDDIESGFVSVEAVRLALQNQPVLTVVRDPETEPTLIHPAVPQFVSAIEKGDSTDV